MRIFGHIFIPRKWTQAGVLSIRHQISEEGHPLVKHRIDDAWVYDYSCTECGRYRVKDNRLPWQLRAPNVGHLYAPGMTFWEKNPSRAKGWRSSYVIFTGGAEMGLERLISASTGYARFTDPQDGVGPLLLKMANIAAEEKEEGYFKVHSLFLELIDKLLRSRKTDEGRYEHGRTTNRISLHTPLIQNVLKYFEPRLSEPVTLKQLARHLAMAPSTLSHCYRKEAGEPPLTTLRNLRLAQARLMLLAKERFKNIAEATGFCDAYHFSKVFKKVEGISPRAFVHRYYKPVV